MFFAIPNVMLTAAATRGIRPTAKVQLPDLFMVCVSHGEGKPVPTISAILTIGTGRCRFTTIVNGAQDER